MEELSAVHRYAAGALFSLALNQAQIQRQSRIPEILATDDDGPSAPQISGEKGDIQWSSESCGLLRHIFRYLNIDPHAWAGIEITACLSDAKHHVGPSTLGNFELPSGSSGSTDEDRTEKNILSPLSVIGLSPRLSFYTKEIQSTLSTYGMSPELSAQTTQLIKAGMQASLSSYGLCPPLSFSAEEVKCALSTLGLSPRSSFSATKRTSFNPTLPEQRRQSTLTTLGLSPRTSISGAYPTGKEVESIISAIRISSRPSGSRYPALNFHPSVCNEEKEKFIRILHEDNLDTESTLPTSSVQGSSAAGKKAANGEKSVAALAKAVDAMALSLEELASPKPSSSKDPNFEETFVARVTSANTEQPSASSPNSTQRWASMKKPLIDRQTSESPKGSVQKIERDDLSEIEDKQIAEQQTLIKQRKIAVLYEVLTACVADTPEEKAGKSVLRAGYDARQRAALRLLALWLDVDWQKVAAIELMVAYMAMAAEKEREAEKASHPDDSRKSSWAKWKRGGIIGAAAITGGALLAVTGGLAAPAIAAGLTALAPAVIGVGGLATAVGSAAGSVAVAASFGAAGAGLAGTKMARRTGGVDEFMFLPIGDNHQQGRLAVGIVVSGIAFEPEDFTKPWEGPDWDLERFALRWESKELIGVSTAIEDWLASSAARELVKAGAMMTVLAGLVAALAWPATLLAATDWIDSKWTIAVDRSDKAGKILAKCLLRGSQGNRPVTLMGFSLGARVIFSCLEYLAEKGDTASIVERVVLLGAPITLDEQRWKKVRKVVSGRFINAYSTNDWILGVIYRASLVTQGLAGIQSVKMPGIENIDVSDIVRGHSKYLSHTSEILKALDIDSFYPIYPSKLHLAEGSP